MRPEFGRERRKDTTPAGKKKKSPDSYTTNDEDYYMGI
jgi:hypothetical protein